MSRWLLSGLLAFGWTLPAQAAPAPQDFAHGIPLQTTPGADVYELSLPEEVYQGITRNDLGDVRVFNADGDVVQHALCAAEPVPQQPLAARVTLHVFPLLPGMSAQRAVGSRVTIKTPQGTEVTVDEPQAQAALEYTATHDGAIEVRPQPAAHVFVLDARHVTKPLRKLQFDWRTEDGRAELALQIEASEDLDEWREVVGHTTLLRSQAQGQTLERAEVLLPEAQYPYLRVTPLDGDVVLHLEGVTAETVQRTPPLPPQLVWLDTEEGRVEGAGSIRYYQTRSRTPVEKVRFRLPASNLDLRLTVSSRDDAAAPWQLRTAGNSQARTEAELDEGSAPLAVGITQDRLWRVEVSTGAETLGLRHLGLMLGYMPARLRFLAQGNAPYMLVYGSQRVPPAALIDCHRMLGLDGKPPAAAVPEIAQSLGGGQPLPPPPPPPTPVRRIVLWFVLGFGALLVVLMAMSLLKRLKQPPP